MATEKMIKGRRCRSYNGVWVSADGNCVEVDTIWKTGFSEIPTTKPAKVHTDKNGEKYVKRKMRNSFYNVYIKDAVYACFCPPKPNNGKEYVVYYKDGNKNNLNYTNLDIKEVVKVTTHTTANKVKLNNGLTVTKDGRIFKGKQEVHISDCISDADTNLMSCILPHVSDPNKMSGHLFVNDLMATAGYVNGEKFSLKSPVILHKDNNPTNFNSDNLTWVESTDPRYIEYQKKVKEWKHQRNVELNPGQQLHPGW